MWKNIMTNRRKTQKKQNPWVSLVSVLIIFSGIVFIFFKPVKPIEQRYQEVAVIQVYDGDTIKIDTGERVRLIGIDTPEVHENPKMRRDSERTKKDLQTILVLGKKAKVFAQSLLEGKKVRLDFDVEQKDKYGRLLAYVYLMDGRFVNEEIMRNGYAYPMTIPPNVRYADDFRAWYREAVEQKRGLWAETQAEDPSKFEKKRKRR